MKYGCIGNPLGHSFSEIIHSKIGRYEYKLRPLLPEDVDSFMTERDFLGINVTIPYKQTVIPYLDHIDGMAKEIGAVNTVVNDGGMLTGYNTDVFGFLAGCGIIKKERIILCNCAENDTHECVCPRCISATTTGSNMKKGGFRERHMPPDGKMSNQCTGAVPKRPSASFNRASSASSVVCASSCTGWSQSSVKMPMIDFASTA